MFVGEEIDVLECDGFSSCIFIGFIELYVIENDIYRNVDFSCCRL